MTSFNLVDDIDNDKLERMQYDYRIEQAINSMCIRLGLSLQEILKLNNKYSSLKTQSLGEDVDR